MKILIVIVQVCGLAFVVGFVFALLNYFFGLKLGIKGAAVPADPAAGVVFLVLGVVCILAGRFLGKKFLNE